MESEEVYKSKLENQSANWKNTVDGLKVTIEQAEVDAKAKLHDQPELLHDKHISAKGGLH